MWWNGTLGRINKCVLSLEGQIFATSLSSTLKTSSVKVQCWRTLLSHTSQSMHHRLIFAISSRAYQQMIISEVDSPVLSTFLMTTATWPFNMEFSSLTIRMRQVQRASNDRANKINPTARSGRSANTNMWVPEERDEDDSMSKITEI